MAVGGRGRRRQGHVGPGRVLLLLQVEALDGGDEVPQGGRDLLRCEDGGRRWRRKNCGGRRGRGRGGDGARQRG